jgi:hypothetical protein
MHAGVRFILLYILFCLETKSTGVLAVASGAKKQKKPTHEGQALLSIYILNTSCDAFL